MRTAVANGLIGLVLVLSLAAAAPPPASAAPVCSTTNVPVGYAVQLCLTAPAAGATVSVAVAVTATVRVSGTAPAVNGITYTLDGGYILFDEQTPYAFQLHTYRYATGAHELRASVAFSGGYTTPPLALPLRIAASAAPSQPPAFTPTTGTEPTVGMPFVVAAVGDGASGLTAEDRTASMIAAWRPNLFLYLGDVYAHGAAEEYLNWYGENGTFYSRLRSITNPTLGNHEFELDPTGRPYYEYWGNPPPYYSYDTHGWHIITLDDVTPGTSLATTSAQYRWLSADLTAHPNPCTLVTAHRPRFNEDSDDPAATDFDAIWRLITSHHIPLMINGHAHHYERWQPLDADGTEAADGTTEFVVGTGGQWISPLDGDDPRVAASFATTETAWGAAQFGLSSSGATYRFVNNAGTTEDFGSLPCAGVHDTTAPAVPTGLTARAAGAHDVNMSWAPSGDDVGVTGYTILRNGVRVAAVPGYQTSFADISTDASPSAEYAVVATDDAHHASPPSASVSVSGR